MLFTFNNAFAQIIPFGCRLSDVFLVFFIEVTVSSVITHGNINSITSY